ncbi:hypothetical protein L2E82_03198 [Cichorium intybus]|uniref:Uncharacterized protein n=1 Tax=Cichorium intybus TaxID=13427 RepID=A0ACB9H5M0_CICIN|nr:hypothetical protein L2E82_03198 [Cichorium intybus]
MEPAVFTLKSFKELGKTTPKVLMNHGTISSETLLAKLPHLQVFLAKQFKKACDYYYLLEPTKFTVT